MTKYNDLIGDILEQSGEKDHYTGKGKGKPFPKEYLQMDTFQNFQKIAKDAGFLPRWIQIQKEIAVILSGPVQKKEVSEMNKKIKEYNKLCPPSLQKGLITLENLDAARKIWG